MVLFYGLFKLKKEYMGIHNFKRIERKPEIIIKPQQNKTINKKNYNSIIKLK